MLVLGRTLGSFLRFTRAAHAAAAAPIVSSDSGSLAAVAALPLAGIRGGETLVSTLARALLRRADRGSVPHSGLGPYAAATSVLVNRSRWRGAAAAAKRCADRQAAEVGVEAMKKRLQRARAMLADCLRGKGVLG